MCRDIKVIFIDLDYTLFDDKKRKWDIKSLKALKKLQSKGIKVFINTSRPYHSVKCLGFFELFTPDGCVCTNGCVVFVGDKLIYHDCFSKKVIQNIIDIANKYNLVIQFASAKDRYFSKEPDHYIDNYRTRFVETIPDIHEWNGEDISALLLHAPKELDEEITKLYDKEIQIPYRFDDCGVDIHTHKVNKGIGVNKVLSYLEINKENTMSFGDDYGDIAMFETTGIGVAVKNNRPIVEKKSSYVTKDVRHHGVYHAIKHFKLLK